MRLLNAKHK